MVRETYVKKLNIMKIAKSEIPSRYDVAFLRPDYLPRRERFETSEDVVRAWQSAKKRLAGSKSQIICEAVEAIDRCMIGEEACGLTICPKCARAYRRLFGRDVLQTLPNGNDILQFVTILDSPVDDKELRYFSIGAFHDNIRQKLRRCGLGSTVTIGGTEFARHTPDEGWVPHLHLIMRAPPKEALDDFRSRSKKTVPLIRPVHTKPVDNLIGLCTYIQKFSLLDWPLDRTGPSRSASRSLPSRQARILARLLLRHSFSAFPFLVGCKHRGNGIVVY